MKKGLNVLSLFDGISNGQTALERAKVKVDNYYASEVDKHAIAETMANYPNTKQIGCVTKVKDIDLGEIDLLIGGSPCQGFSYAGKQLNFQDQRSKLFFDFIDVKNKFNPKYFMLENVNMKQEYIDVISEKIGCEPIKINSSLVSAQNRVRLYWTNIKFDLPDDKGIKLSDILEEQEFISPAAIRGRRLNKATILGRRLDTRGKRQDYNKNIPIMQCLEVRKTNTDKSNCLTTVDKDNVLTPLAIGRHPDPFNRKLPFRYYTLKEKCRLQTVADDFFKVSSETQASKMLGNGWTVDIIASIFKGLT